MAHPGRSAGSQESWCSRSARRETPRELWMPCCPSLNQQGGQLASSYIARRNCSIRDVDTLLEPARRHGPGQRRPQRRSGRGLAGLSAAQVGRRGASFDPALTALTPCLMRRLLHEGVGWAWETGEPGESGVSRARWLHGAVRQTSRRDGRPTRRQTGSPDTCAQRRWAEKLAGTEAG